MFQEKRLANGEGAVAFFPAPQPVAVELRKEQVAAAERCVMSPQRGHQSAVKVLGDHLFTSHHIYKQHSHI
jgi:hypothetical protein